MSPSFGPGWVKATLGGMFATLDSVSAGDFAVIILGVLAALALLVFIVTRFR